MAVAELQERVENLLRTLPLEEITGVANHLQVAVEETDTRRQVMRKVEDAFEAEGDDAAREVLLRNLPLPVEKQADYNRLLNPDEYNEQADDIRPLDGAADDQVVPPGGHGDGDQAGRMNGPHNENNDMQHPLQNGLGGGLGGMFGQQQQQNLGGIGGLQAGAPNLGLGGVPQNGGARARAPGNDAGANHNIWNGGQPQNRQDLGALPNNMQHPQLPQQGVVQMFAREFRMNGTICDDIDKSISYLDICRQIADGRRKGYSDDHLMSGMRRIISSGAVKTYVDSQENLTLTAVLSFLRSFLKTETPSELNNKLSQLAQQEGQPAIKFFMDALQIRQLIVVSAQVEGNAFYDPKLVHATFLHTVRTGLRDESIRSHMLPFLSETNLVDDNSLIRELHKAVGETAERRKKTEQITDKKHSVKVNSVETSPELSALLKLVQDNQNQMMVMQKQMGEMLKSNPAVKRFFKKPGCTACAAANKAESCRHCWKCGEDGHKASETDKCPKSN